MTVATAARTNVARPSARELYAHERPSAASALEALRCAFIEDRAALVAALPLGTPAPGTCRYCGGRWRPFPASKLDGHARCYVSPAFRELLDPLLYRADVSYRAIAVALNVGENVVRVWHREDAS